ncbi:conserved protein of unknown function [Candidatus Filomicrobium marinum]|uniref:Uncharacterized protein n=1 Tax=Candidatus Filomicrobium marinum TaxID=1608628 RepID=A0A0D6JGD9_9HYPH|nr:circularly permuted type 2 ATP-grasp protein [Candidatus Filomicrobium marinum]CFX51600.1 conserved protein of unknown function [Candidatus Filomicrobium marinum]CPR20112.1 conserved protein of unknown function [Candidatus Filomicrobium marinum]
MTMSAQQALPPSGSLLAGYRPIAGVRDELLDEHGRLRAHWADVLEALEGLGDHERHQRSDRLNHRVRELGIANDIYADPSNTEQPWHLDLIPLIISPAEWRWLEAAMIQRARLMDEILKDVYGEQNLMRRNLLPPSLVFSDPAFLRPCVGIKPTGSPLQFYAADIARGADGMWRIIDSHAETMAGIGFALANRVVLTQVAGDLSKTANIMRLSSFFSDMQASLFARSERPDPRIALLTSGPTNSDYFSHAYIARYLGCLLVEGGDLSVVNERLYLKTLEGLKAIDQVVRCTEAASSDPLELNPSDFGGPVGLVQAAQYNPDLIVNALGSAIVENRGLSGYLPRLCQELLGEPLTLGDAPRYWLGDAEAREQVLRNPDKWIFRAAHEGTGRPGRATAGRILSALDSGTTESLRTEVELFGQSMVAEAPVGFATTPSLGENGLHPVPYAVRIFVSATEDGYRVMPGGIAMTVETQSVALSAPSALTRDVWISSDTRSRPHTSLWRPAIETATVDRSQRALQSRVADNLFWLGRYAERTDWIMRALRSALERLDQDVGASPDGPRAARRCLSSLIARDSDVDLPGPEVSDVDALNWMIGQLLCNDTHVCGLIQTVEALHRTLGHIRDRLSLEAWRTLRRLRAADLRGVARIDALEWLEDGLTSIAAFNGLVHENMTRNFGWAFLDMGRRLERAYNLSEAIDALIVKSEEHSSAELVLLLELGDSFMTYRSRYRLEPMLHLVLDLLCLDEANPRSIAFQLAAISNHLEHLPKGRLGNTLSEERRLVLGLRTSVQLAQAELLADKSGDSQLRDVLTEQMDKLPRLSDAIMRSYFNPSDERPSRVFTRLEPTQ